jgi:outer membrane receptor protein involved in Fe transport
VDSIVTDYDLALYSNFTYLLDDPVDGDQFEQADDRRIYGASISGDSELALGGRTTAIRWGGDVRYDDIDEVGLYDTVGREQTDTVLQDNVEELSLDVWAEAEVIVNDRLRTTVGLRADYYDWDVQTFQPENSGSGNDRIISPKLGLAYRFHDRLEGYANWGRGFHSNDVRGATISIDPGSGDAVDRVPALVPSDGGEVGLRYEQSDTFNASLVAFWLDLDSELVFVGDAGTTEPNGATRRIGIELSGF